MIPKVIHYCWFGRNPLPKLAIKCIESWKKYMPDYEIKEWNEDNFNVNLIPYTQQAYAAKKYAYVSDYARLWILYHYGGIYLDTDVEVLKSLTPIIERGPYLGCENQIDESHARLQVNSGLGMASDKNNPLVKNMMELYHGKEFVLKENNSVVTIVSIISDMLYKRGLKSINEIQLVDSFYIYPAEYFASRRIAEYTIPRTDNSYSIHHYMGSWESPYIKLKNNISKVLGHRLTRVMVKAKRKTLTFFKK